MQKLFPVLNFTISFIKNKFVVNASQSLTVLHQGSENYSAQATSGLLSFFV